MDFSEQHLSGVRDIGFLSVPLIWEQTLTNILKCEKASFYKPYQQRLQFLQSAAEQCLSTSSVVLMSLHLTPLILHSFAAFTITTIWSIFWSLALDEVGRMMSSLKRDTEHKPKLLCMTNRWLRSQPIQLQGWRDFATTDQTRNALKMLLQTWRLLVKQVQESLVYSHKINPNSKPKSYGSLPS